MADNPAFAVTPRIASVNIATANTNRDGTGTIGTLITGVAAGTRIAEIVVKAVGVTTAGMVRVYLHDGTTAFLFDEITVAAVASPGAATQTTRVSVAYVNLILPNASWSVRVSTHNAESMNVTALGADL